MSNSLSFSKQLLAYHLSIIPVDADKRPVVKWERYQRELAKEEDLIKWYSVGNNGIGLVCGKISGGIEAIDIDLKYDRTGCLYEEFIQLVKELGGALTLEKLVVQKTASGGIHWIYKCSEIEGNKKLASRETTDDEKQLHPKEKVKVLIETRGEGGYIKLYSFIQGDLSNIPIISPEERQILFDAARALNQVQQVLKPEIKNSTLVSENGLSPFQDYNQRGNCVELLESHGWTVTAESSTKVTLKRPGETSSKYSGYFNFEKNWFSVFSTSTEFDAQTAYLPYAVFAFLECNKDFKQAYQKLYDLGYGDRRKEKKVKEEASDELSPIDKAIDHLNSYQLKRNEVTSYLEIKGNAQNEQQLNSIILDTRRSVKISKDDIHTILNSNEIPAYNPIREFFLNNQALNPKGEINKLINSIQPVTTNYNQIFVTRWLIGLVASVFENTANVLMLVLVGGINIGKTQFFERLLPEALRPYYARNKLDQGKDSESLMCNKLLILNDELDNLTKYEAKTFRNFISGSSYTFRPPYGRQDITKKRLASLCGTSNEADIISDHQNNRRIIPINVTQIDFNLYNSVDKVALLMEIYHLYKNGTRWELTQSEVEHLKKSTLDYRTISIERDLIDRFFKVPEGPQDEASKRFVSFSEIFTRLERETKVRITPKSVGAALKECGFIDCTKKIPGTRKNQRGYEVVELLGKTASIPSYQYQ